MGNFCEAPQVQLSNGPLLISSYIYKNLLISLFQGDLSEEDTDAIVLSNTPTLSTTYPPTRSILSRAGSKPQIEVKELLISLKHFDYGMALYTTAGELDAFYLIHAIIPEWTGGSDDQKFEECIQNCLKIAEKLRFGSITFPILGTSNNSFPKQTSCELLFKGLKDWIDEKDEGQIELKEVRIISSENPTVRLMKTIGDKAFYVDRLSKELERKGSDAKRYESVCLTNIEKKV